MRRPLLFVVLAALAGMVLAATVFREDFAQAAGLAGSAPVTVTNTAANPVPVREQNLDSNGNVKVSVQGTVPVNVPASSPAEPYQTSLGCDFIPTFISCGDVQFVPDGKRFVIQTISARGQANLGVTVGEFQLRVGNQDELKVYSLLGRIAFRINETSQSVAEAREVTLYADPGPTLRMAAFTTDDAGEFGQATVTASGYLVPVP
jgi:hypothetical protein